MNLFFYGNCQMRQIYRILEFLVEPHQHTLIFINDIDKLDESHVPLVEAALKQCDTLISTFVSDYKSEDFRTPKHLSLARSAIILPNIYFFGIKPNVGELMYPDGSRGYEDIWLYQLLLNIYHSVEFSAQDINYLGKTINEQIYYESDDPSLIPIGFSQTCLSSSFEQMKIRESAIQDICHSFSEAQHLSVSSRLGECIDRGIEPIFYTTDHPSLSFLIEITISILELLGLEACPKRLSLLRNDGIKYINSTSTDFLYISSPCRYKKEIGILRPDQRAFIEYRERFSFVEHVNLSIVDYMYQLSDRIRAPPPSILEINQEKLTRYREMNRVLDLTALLA